MRDDLKAAFRSLKSSWTFTVVALTVLALGIGAGTAVFSVVDAVVLRGLPFDEHDRLVALGDRRPPSADFPLSGRDPEAVSNTSPQNYRDWAAEQQVFEAIAAIASADLTLRQPGGEPEEVRAQRVTAGFFSVLREYPVMGAPFTAENEVDGNHRVAVLSDGLWRRRFGADPDIVGKTIPLGDGGYQVVGVMGPEFAYPVGAPRGTDLWVPYVVPADQRIRSLHHVRIYLQTIARLKPGVSLEQAQANMDQIAAALRKAHPKWNKDAFIGVRSLRDHIVGVRTTQWMLMLLGAVAIVLLIACANVANLLLARAMARQREVGIRAALGAGRWRLIRQFMVESLVLSVLGTILAVLLGSWAVGVLKNFLPDDVPRVAEIALDLRVLGGAAVLSVVTGILFGIFPALQLSRPDLTSALKGGAHGASTGGGRQRLRGLLVVSEVALAVVLLVGAALFIGSFRTLMRIDPGFNPENVLTAGLQPRVDESPVTDEPASDYAMEIEEILERIRLAPGVAYASAIAGGIPLGGSAQVTTMTTPGRDLPRDDSFISIRQVTPDYHQAMGIPLITGRFFEVTDREGTAPVAIINESAAARYFPGENAIGKVVGVNGERTIVGIVGDVVQSSLETEPRTEVYVPVEQDSAILRELVIRTTEDPYAVLPAVKAAVMVVLPDIPLRNIRTMEELIARRVAQRRFNMLLLGFFGMLGLVIAAAGIYGVMAYVVSQRTREIGMRMALGATRGAIIGMVLRGAMLMVAAGLVIGTAGAWLLRTTAQAFLFGMEVNDPRAFAAAIGVLALAALAACVIPARRAAAVDPMNALRAE